MKEENIIHTIKTGAKEALGIKEILKNKKYWWSEETMLCHRIQQLYQKSLITNRVGGNQSSESWKFISVSAHRRKI